MKTDKAQLFGLGSQENALANALVYAANAESFKEGNEKIYDFLEKTPKTSLICHLVEALNEYGFKIVKS